MLIKLIPVNSPIVPPESIIISYKRLAFQHYINILIIESCSGNVTLLSRIVISTVLSAIWIVTLAMLFL